MIKKLNFGKPLFKWLVLISVFVTLFATIDEIFDEDDRAFGSLLLEYLITLGRTLIVVFLLYLLVSTVVNILNEKLPWGENRVRRFVVELLSILVLSTVLAFIGAGIFMLVHERELQHSHMFYTLKSLRMLYFVFLLFFTVFEAINQFQEKEKWLLLSEKYEKQHMRSQLEVLRNQVNPHFLFNSLNVLSSLIYKDVEKADRFIHEFAKVYRYLLDMEKDSLVKLSEEMKFLESYIFLQKIRFGENLKIQISIDESLKNKWVPPLSLQMLFENAIKHNVISVKMPLLISMVSNNDVLVIKNNIQPRQTEVISTGLGQQNIKKRYELISQLSPEFYLLDDFYIAKLPLISDQ